MSLSSVNYSEMVDAVNQQGNDPDYERIPGPRPWEMESIEAKEKYLKRAYATVEKNIINRELRAQEENERVQAEIEKIKKALKSKEAEAANRSEDKK